jgi:hypothetical protein
MASRHGGLSIIIEWVVVLGFLGVGGMCGPLFLCSVWFFFCFFFLGLWGRVLAWLLAFGQDVTEGDVKSFCGIDEVQEMWYCCGA